MNFNPDGYEIIDAHVHPVAEIAGSDFHTFDDSECVEGGFFEPLRRAGIARCCGSVIRKLRPEELHSFAAVHQLNEAALTIRSGQPAFYLPGIAVHPAFPEESCREVECMYREHGVRFVGELVAYMMGYDNYAVPELNPVWELIDDLGMTLNLHLNRLAEAETILKNFPDIKLIIAHPTLSPDDYTDRLTLAAKYPNTALDISGSGPNMWGMLRHGIRVAGAEKLIFGTDYPLRNPGMYVAGVYAERLSDQEMEAIFSGNIKRLLA